MEYPGQEKFEAPEKDKVYDLLSNHRRRYTIHFLKHRDGPATLGELAEQIAAWEQDKEIAEITSDERKRVYTSLQQTHIPRLEEAGMIAVDRDEIELTEGATELEIYLDIVPSGSIPWGIYYLGLSILGVVVLAAVWSGFIPDDPVPPLGWMALILGAFLASAVYHVINNRRYRLGSGEDPPT